ncbi:MAG: diguanylate cyclase [Actinomycetota bacterium]|nr:diguanylate cyclase [Actinomycetota bacterium]MDD5600167.1 diguanylate cyclase [Actinomycetota bacterium]
MIDALMEYITDSIYFKDLNSRFIRINKACAEKFRMKSPDDAIGKTDFDVFTEEHARQAFEDEQKIIKTGKPIIGIEEKETWEEEVRWASTTKMPLYNGDGEIIGTFGISRDITDKKKAEEEIEEGRAKIEAVLHSTADGIYAADDKGNIILYNNKFLQLWNIPKKIVDLKSYDEVLEYMASQVTDPDSFLRKINELGKTKIECIDIINFKDGRIYERTSCPLKQEKKITGRVWSFRDVTEQKKAEEKIWYLSFHDKLTGLYNRAYFEEELKRLNTQRQLPITIIFCDVNGLKEMNDNYGYNMGDKLLCKVAEILKSCFRSEDVVVRWGGDEFIIVLPLTDDKTADEIIGRLRRKCEQSSRPDFPVSISIGKAVKERLSQSIDMVINTAEKRMLMNKKTIKASR